MTLQADGQISFSDLVGEYGGTAPHAISEYYRNGGLVPDTVVEGENTYAWTLNTDTTYEDGASGNYVLRYASTNDYGFFVGGTRIYLITSFAYPFFISIGGSGSTPPTGLGQDYEEWSPRSPIWQTNATGTYYDLRIKEYVSFQTGSETTVSVNQNVPTSGVISLSNFYGGRAS